MRQFVVVWSADALNQLDDIYEYIAIDSLQSAAKVVLKILESTNRLQFFPLSGQQEIALKKMDAEYRYVLSGNYKIVYRLSDRIVYVVAVFDTRQDPDKLIRMVLED